MATLAEIRAKLKAQDTRTSTGFVGDNAIYPHWNIAEGTEAVLRFLPDKDQNNYTFDRFKTKKTEDIPTETDNNVRNVFVFFNFVTG